MADSRFRRHDPGIVLPFPILILPRLGGGHAGAAGCGAGDQPLRQPAVPASRHPGIRHIAAGRQGGAGPGAGGAGGGYLFWGLRDPQILILAALITGVTTWAVFEGLRSLQFNPFYINVTDEPPPFQTLLLAGIIASAANAFLLASMVEGRVSAGQVTTLLAAYVTGDVTGLLVVMLVAPWLLRFLR